MFIIRSIFKIYSSITKKIIQILKNITTKVRVIFFIAILVDGSFSYFSSWYSLWIFSILFFMLA